MLQVFTIVNYCVLVEETVSMYSLDIKVVYFVVYGPHKIHLPADSGQTNPHTGIHHQKEGEYRSSQIHFDWLMSYIVIQKTCKIGLRSIVRSSLNTECNVGNRKVLLDMAVLCPFQLL